MSDKEKPTVLTGDTALHGAMVHATDEALFKGALTGEGLVPVTGEFLEKVGERVEEEKSWLKDDVPRIVNELSGEQRLAAAAWMIGHIVNHMQEGGSFRYLIYERLGFGPEGYVPLCMAGGLVISNMCNDAADAAEKKES